jgi:hypothetical protein
MDSTISQAQREQVAQQWRASAQAQSMQPSEIEYFAQLILMGQADGQVRHYLYQTRSRPQQLGTGTPGFSFQTPFGTIQMPGLASFPSLPPLPLLPGMQPFPPMQPLQSLPQLSGMAPLMNAPPLQPMWQTTGTPQSFSQSVSSPGGDATQQNVSFSGQSGDATFSYTSTSASGTWSSDNTPVQMQPAQPVLPAWAQPAAIEHVSQPQPGLSQSTYATAPPVQAPPPFPQQVYAPPPSQAPVEPPPYQSPPQASRMPPPPMPASFTEPQNARMHETLLQQMMQGCNSQRW